MLFELTYFPDCLFFGWTTNRCLANLNLFFKLFKMSIWEVVVLSIEEGVGKPERFRAPPQREQLTSPEALLPSSSSCCCCCLSTPDQTRATLELSRVEAALLQRSVVKKGTREQGHSRAIKLSKPTKHYQRTKMSHKQ